MGNIIRTVICWFLGLLRFGILDGSKSGGYHLFKTLRSPIASCALLFSLLWFDCWLAHWNFSWYCIKDYMPRRRNGSLYIFQGASRKVSKTLFEGCSVYFNTSIENKKQQELRNLLQERGGTVIYSFKKKTTTHVVTEWGDLSFSEYRAAIKHGIHIVSVSADLSPEITNANRFLSRSPCGYFGRCNMMKSKIQSFILQIRWISSQVLLCALLRYNTQLHYFNRFNFVTKIDRKRTPRWNF